MGCRVELWTIVPQHAPRIWRHCPSCGKPRRFVCAERFRTNAQKKTLDVWLKYRCELCTDVWKAPLLERRAVHTVPADLLEAFTRHDRATVWRYAFELRVLRAHVMRIEDEIDVAVTRTQIDATCGCAFCVRLSMPLQCEVRLDRLLAQQLSLSRSLLQGLHREGALLIDPADQRALRKSARDGQRLCFARAPH